jgi:hypothetical protein
VELNKHNSVGKGHQTNKHQIHADRNNTQASVVRYQWLILPETVLVDQSGANHIHEIPVEEGVDKHD